MQYEQEPYAKEFIEGMRKVARCDWCGRDTRTNRKGLCRHCNEVRKDLERVEKLTSDVAEPKTFMLDWRQRVARQKKEDCIVWGQMLRGILSGGVEPLALEHWFCMVSKRIARDSRMHYGTATMLGWTCTPA